MTTFLAVKSVESVERRSDEQRAKFSCLECHVTIVPHMGVCVCFGGARNGRPSKRDFLHAFNTSRKLVARLKLIVQSWSCHSFRSQSACCWSILPSNIGNVIGRLHASRRPHCPVIYLSSDLIPQFSPSISSSIASPSDCSNKVSDSPPFH